LAWRTRINRISLRNASPDRLTGLKTCARCPDGNEHVSIAFGKAFHADIVKHGGGKM